MAIDWTTVGTLVAAFCAAAGVIWPMRRAQRTDLRKFIQESVTQQVTVAKTHSDDAIEAVREQVRALEIDLARNYVMKRDLEGLEKRLTDNIRSVADQVADLNKYLRKREADR